MFRFTAEERERVLKILRETLIARPEILFAYLYGSFLKDRLFHDIDVGIYVTPEVEASRLSPDLAAELEAGFGPFIEGANSSRAEVGQRGKRPSPSSSGRCGVLNKASVSVCYHVLKGRLLFSGDENVRVRWAVQVISRYLDLKTLRHRALKEAMTSWR